MENGELRQWICEAKNIRTGWMWKDDCRTALLRQTAMRHGIRSSFGTGDMRAAMFSGVSGLTAQTGRTGVSTTTVNNY